MIDTSPPEYSITFLVNENGQGRNRAGVRGSRTYEAAERF